ncbi:MAG: hypothetical protein M3331_08405 [Actinomycetota bacterium]|nr:hypothetical protein [Actinomycetota bacterium]
MADRLLASHLLAKVAPPVLLLYLLVGGSGSYTFSAENGMVEECSRSLDYVALALAGAGLAVAAFLLYIAARPRHSADERGAFGNRIGAAVVIVLSALLLLKGISAEGPTDLATCASNS